MKSRTRLVIATVILLLSVLACEFFTGGDGGDNNIPRAISTIPVLTDEPIPVPTEPSVPENILLSDDFSHPQWMTDTNIDGAVEYVNEALNFDVYTEDFDVWSAPNDEIYENIHMEVAVVNNDTDPNTAFGFICNKSAGNDYYYLIMSPAGQYAIALATDGGRDIFLTNNDDWGNSTLIAKNAENYHMEADCGNGRLTLYVDGVQIASVDDDTYNAGRVALMVWSADDIGVRNNVSFDDFKLTELK